MSTPILKMTCKSTWHVDHSDLEEFINKCIEDGLINVQLDSMYEIICEEEWLNYESHEITVTNVVEEDARQELANGKVQYKLNHIMSLLAEADLIPEGNYVIKVLW